MNTDSYGTEGDKKHGWNNLREKQHSGGITEMSRIPGCANIMDLFQREKKKKKRTEVF